ncbi:MAG: hypothetical protein GY794_03605 [bacterium]|nr:hypothetical protein [bacterium]
MKFITRTKLAPLALILITMTALGGCTKEIPIIQYPVFWDRAPKSIAVTPFRSETRMRHMGAQIASDLASLLSINGSYTVHDRGALRAYLNERELQQAFSSDREVASSAMVKIGKVQALLTGTVTACNWPRTRSESRVISQRFYNPNGTSYTRPVRQRFYTNEAEIRVNASLLRITPNGPQVIHSCPVVGYAKSEGVAPSLSRDGCLSSARNQVVQQLLENFAVVRKMIKVKPSETFFTATGQPYAGKWPKSKKFSASSGQNIIIVLKLPPQCDRNRFRITVSRKEGRSDLFSHEVRWTKALSMQGGLQLKLSPSDLASKGGGRGEYIIRLFSGQAEAALDHKIKIE